jgi:polysaccharide deacetylase 2 family uncharacterized protein YibQ
MENNQRLFFAWSIFFATAFLFIVSVEMYYSAQKSRVPNFQYRILIDKNSIIENEERNSEAIQQEENRVDEESEFYERTKYGYLPKFSKDGVGVFDRYSTGRKVSSEKELQIAVLIDDVSKIDSAMKLSNQKITFIVPHYIDDLGNIVKIIRQNGHEFFIQMPTQSSIPVSKKETVSPFFANANIDTTLEKLFCLLASTKYAIGIANVSPTLLTKSKKDMSVIAEALARRGLAFFDFEKSNDLLQGIAQKSNLIYIRATDVLESEKSDIPKSDNKSVLMIRLTHFENFIKNLPTDIQLTPVSASVRRDQ